MHTDAESLFSLFRKLPHVFHSARLLDFYWLFKEFTVFALLAVVGFVTHVTGFDFVVQVIANFNAHKDSVESVGFATQCVKTVHVP